MSKNRFSVALAATLAFAMPALAGEIMVDDPYARSSGPSAKSGAIFMVLMNQGATDDRLIAATTEAAARAELHTHISDANGVMKMVEVEEGFAVPAHGSHALARGGDHVMLMGLTRPLNDGDMITLTLSFETAGEITVEVPVDLTRKPGHGAMQPKPISHGDMKSGG